MRKNCGRNWHMGKWVNCKIIPCPRSRRPGIGDDAAKVAYFCRSGGGGKGSGGHETGNNPGNRDGRADGRGVGEQRRRRAIVTAVASILVLDYIAVVAAAPCTNEPYCPRYDCGPPARGGSAAAIVVARCTLHRREGRHAYSQTFLQSQRISITNSPRTYVHLVTMLG